MRFVKDILNLRNYTLLWLGQSVSILGSSMTGFAITIWAFERTGNALTLSISGLLIMVPKMLGGLLAGPFVDRFNKKTIILFSDLGSGLCTLTLFLLLKANSLEIWHIYCLNFISSILGSFQSPANNVVVSQIVPKEYYIKANGMQSFSSGTIQILSPIFAATMLGVTGILGVIAFDFATLIFACLTLICFVEIPFISNKKANKFSFISYLSELRSGFNVILDSSLLSKLLLLMAFINLVAGITYFNLISPMILSRSGNDSNALALVNGALGLGGIIGGLLSTFIPTTKSKIKTMFLCVGLSFLLGDILFAVGNSKLIWVIAGFLSSVFIPIFSANESYFWRTIIPIELQGRAFSFKYALQSGMVPIGMLLGGILADYFFEPFMLNVSNPLTLVVGSGKGSGMAVMFLLTGVMGTILSVLGFVSRTLLESEKGL
jgi:MFS family permease